MTVIQTKRVYYSLEFLNWLAVALPLPFAVLFMQARGLDLFQMGLLSGIYSVTIVLLELPTGGLADAIGRKPVTLMSYLATLGSSLVFLLSFSLPVFALAWILLGIGRALASGALSAWFVDALLASDPEIDLQPALAQAGTFTILGLSLGTLIGGLIPELFAFLPEEGSAIFTPLAMTIFFAILLKGLNTLLLIVFVRESRPKVKQDAPLSIRSLPMIIKDAFVQTAYNPIIKWRLLASLVGLL